MRRSDTELRSTMRIMSLAEALSRTNCVLLIPNLQTTLSRGLHECGGFANAIAVDAFGNVHVAGRSPRDSTISDYATVAYSQPCPSPESDRQSCLLDPLPEPATRSRMLRVLVLIPRAAGPIDCSGSCSLTCGGTGAAP